MLSHSLYILCLDASSIIKCRILKYPAIIVELSHPSILSVLFFIYSGDLLFSECGCVCMFVCVSVCMSVYIYEYMYVCIFVSVNVCMCVPVFVCMCVCKCVSEHVSV